MLRPCVGNWVTAIVLAGTRNNGPLACATLGNKPNELPKLAKKTSSTVIAAVRHRPHPLRNMKNAFLETEANLPIFRVNP